MLKRSSATTADDICAKIFGKMLDFARKIFRRFAVKLFAVFDFGQTRIRQNRNRNRRIFAQIFDVFGHLVGTRAAIHPDNVNRKRFKRSQRGGNFRAVEHRPKSFNRNLRNDRKFGLYFSSKNSKIEASAAFVWKIS